METFQQCFGIMGDEISLQYGGSLAHHSNLNGKKGFFKNALPELWTSVKRHWANNFSDASKQGAINLYLGMYVPYKNTIPLWNLENDTSLHQCDENKLPKLHQNWWEHYLKRYEDKLPVELRNETLNFYVPYEKLRDYERPHFLPDQKISVKTLLEVDEMELVLKNTSTEQRHLYIYDGIEQLIYQEVTSIKEKKKQEAIREHEDMVRSLNNPNE